MVFKAEKFVRYLSGCLLLLSLYCNAGTVYKVEREDGSVYYTDKPVAGAKAVEFSNVNSAVRNAPLASNVRVKATTKAKQPALPDYKLQLLSPANEQHIRDNQGRVSISGQLTPGGAGNFQLWMDGELVQSQPQPSFSLENLDRGAHQVQIKFLHQSGKILALSPVTTFYLHRASILNRAN